jgi:hypothetical protein
LDDTGASARDENAAQAALEAAARINSLMKMQSSTTAPSTTTTTTHNEHGPGSAGDSRMHPSRAALLNGPDDFAPPPPPPPAASADVTASSFSSDRYNRVPPPPSHSATSSSSYPPPPPSRTSSSYLPQSSSNAPPSSSTATPMYQPAMAGLQMMGVGSNKKFESLDSKDFEVLNGLYVKKVDVNDLRTRYLVTKATVQRDIANETGCKSIMTRGKVSTTHHPSCYTFHGDI